MTPEQSKVRSLREAARALVHAYSGTIMDGDDDLATLRAALAADAEERKEIVAVLRDVGNEWVRDRPIVACRQCDGEGRKIATIIHEPDCRLAALLAKLEGKESQ